MNDQRGFRRGAACTAGLHRRPDSRRGGLVLRACSALFVSATARPRSDASDHPMQQYVCYRRWVCCADGRGRGSSSSLYGIAKLSHTVAVASSSQILSTVAGMPRSSSDVHLVSQQSSVLSMPARSCLQTQEKGTGQDGPPQENTIVTGWTPHNQVIRNRRRRLPPQKLRRPINPNPKAHGVPAPHGPPVPQTDLSSDPSPPPVSPVSVDVMSSVSEYDEY